MILMALKDLALLVAYYCADAPLRRYFTLICLSMLAGQFDSVPGDTAFLGKAT